MPELIASSRVRDIPDFPRPGIVFKDITPVLADPAAFREIVEALTAQAEAFAPEAVAGIESRGFLFGAPVALALGVGFVPIRKAGKLPAAAIREDYALEYGTAAMEIHCDAVPPGQRVLVIDDLLATGGTAAAAARLIERLGGTVAAFCFVLELGFLPGRAALSGYQVRSLLTC